MVVDIEKWQDRIENLIQVQKDLCLDQINTTFTRRELIELNILINEIADIIATEKLKGEQNNDNT